MVKTFVLSNVVGAITAVLGWSCAVLLFTSMSTETFDSLRFGWAGLICGSVALVSIFILLSLKGAIEPMMTIVATAAVTAMLWSRRELPIETDSRFVSGTPAYYWATFTIMTLILLLLFLGLRAARVSHDRARP